MITEIIKRRGNIIGLTETTMNTVHRDKWKRITRLKKVIPVEDQHSVEEELGESKEEQ